MSRLSAPRGCSNFILLRNKDRQPLIHIIRGTPLLAYTVFLSSQESIAAKAHKAAEDTPNITLTRTSTQRLNVSMPTGLIMAPDLEIDSNNNERYPELEEAPLILKPSTSSGYSENIGSSFNNSSFHSLGGLPELCTR